MGMPIAQAAAKPKTRAWLLTHIRSQSSDDVSSVGSATIVAVKLGTRMLLCVREYHSQIAPKTARAMRRYRIEESSTRRTRVGRSTGSVEITGVGLAVVVVAMVSILDPVWVRLG